MPRLISGVPVKVGTASAVGVAEGGNQIMVAVGVGVSLGRGVAVAGAISRVRQEDRNVTARRKPAMAR